MSFFYCDCYILHCLLLSHKRESNRASTQDLMVMYSLGLGVEFPVVPVAL